MWAGHGWGAWPIQQAAFANIPSEEGIFHEFLCCIKKLIGALAVSLLHMESNLLA